MAESELDAGLVHLLRSVGAPVGPGVSETADLAEALDRVARMREQDEARLRGLRADLRRIVEDGERWRT